MRGGDGATAQAKKTGSNGLSFIIFLALERHTSEDDEAVDADVKNSSFACGCTIIGQFRSFPTYSTQLLISCQCSDYNAKTTILISASDSFMTELLPCWCSE